MAVGFASDNCDRGRDQFGTLRRDICDWIFRSAQAASRAEQRDDGPEERHKSFRERSERASHVQ